MNHIKHLIDIKSAFLFDLFHTLTSIEQTSPGMFKTADILGVDRKRWTEQLLNNSIERLTGKLKDPYKIIEKMAHSIDPNIPNEIIKKATDKRIEFFKKAIIEMPQSSIDTIIYLKNRNKKLALISNADFMEKMAWDFCPIAQYFDAVIFSCEVGYVKPQKEIYEIAIKNLNESPSNCVFVGDGGSNEFYGAKNLGMTTIMVKGVVEKNWPEKVKVQMEYADYIINDVNELIV
ncbi:MAG: HAD family hydrolase [candidate division WOR-3 bacterium]